MTGGGLTAVTYQAIKKTAKSNSFIGSFLYGMIGGAATKAALDMVPPDRRSTLEDLTRRLHHAPDNQEPQYEDIRDRLKREAMERRGYV